MAQIQEIRRDLKFNISLVEMIETLKSITAAQYASMEKEKERFDRFMNSFSDFFRVVDMADVPNPLVKVTADILGIVVITSDAGFMGGLNQGVIRAALQAQGDQPNNKVALVVIGDKGAGTFQDQDRQFKRFRGIVRETIYEQAVEVKDYLVKEVIEGRMGKVIIAYPKPISFSAQKIDVINLLPCGELFDKHAIGEVADRMEKTEVTPVAPPAPSDRSKSLFAQASDVAPVIIESSIQDMVTYLAETWVVSKLFEVFEDSKLAEFSARSMHLEGSMQKLEKEVKRIKHIAFKAAHEKIDKGMRETFAASGKSKRKRVAPGLAAKVAEEALAAANPAPRNSDA